MLAILLVFQLLTTPASAQCPMPDKLDTPPPVLCCTVVQASLPTFPAFQHPSKEICWLDCQVSQVTGYMAAWTAPVPGPIASSGAVPCGMFRSHLFLFSGSGLKWQGQMQLIYARTWLETTSPARYQVWRFLVNGDLVALASAGSPPCPVPACAPAFNKRVHVTGYIDYALDCSSNQWSFAWMLTHACDFIDHAPGFPRAGAFHPDRAYTFVGPGAGFVPGPVQPIEGGSSTFEDMRQFLLPPLPPTGPILCEYEEPLLSGQITPQQQFCLCTSSTGPNQWVQSNLFLGGLCGNTVQSVVGLFPPGFLSMGIGAWTNPGVYPGTEAVRWNAGGYNDVDACVGIVRQQVYYGVTTIGGFQAFEVYAGGVGPPLPLTFVDQGSSLQPNTHAMIMNVRYISDRILNLNF